MIQGNLIREDFPQTVVEVNYNMDALVPPVGDERPKKLGENIRGSGKPKWKDPETKVSSLTQENPRKDW